MARRTNKITLGVIMFEETLDYAKKSFIEYLLFRYPFKSRISVWILNYLKSDRDFLNHIHFVDQIVPGHPTLEMSISHSSQHAILYTDNNVTLIDSNAIFNTILQNDCHVDIKIHFPNSKYRDQRLDHLLLYQLLNAHHDKGYLHDVYDIEISQSVKRYLIHYLKSQIDLTLMMNEKQQFQYFSKLLNTIQFKEYE